MSHRIRRSRRAQGGFSMVEMLMAAFIMAIGIMGLTMLQTMSIRTATGGKSLSTATMLAERAMDEIQAQGRNCLLYARSTPPVTPTDKTPFETAGTAPGGAPARTYNFAGRTAAGDPIDTNPYFSMYIQRAIDVDPVAGLGGIALMTVTVQWTETAGQPPRQVVLSRRMRYALT